MFSMQIKNVGFTTLALLVLGTAFLVSCRGKGAVEKVLPEIKSTQKNHLWYCFDENGFVQTEGPQLSPQVLEKPWTEAVRISSAASAPVTLDGKDRGYALVNRLGMLMFTEKGIQLQKDTSIFSGVTADSMVFSNDRPVFYLYRSSFFNKAAENGQLVTVQPSRPFLVELNPEAKVFFPLVTYSNLNLADDADIIGYFWDGKTWACSAKRILSDRVEFSYFYWVPDVPITDMSPALSSLGKNSFRPSSEDDFRALNMPKLFSQAPDELKGLLASIPADYTVSVLWRDGSGTTPVLYYQQGTGTAPLEACGALVPGCGYSVAVFSDGTTYIDTKEKKFAFRLPLLPAGYSYGEFALAADKLYVAWEQSSFYKTGRSGFIEVSLPDVIKMVQ